MNGWEQIAATGGPWALVAFLVILVVSAIIRGDLVPRAVHNDLKTELEYERGRTREIDLANRELVKEAARLSVALTVAAVPQPAPAECVMVPATATEAES